MTLFKSSYYHLGNSYGTNNDKIFFVKENNLIYNWIFLDFVWGYYSLTLMLWLESPPKKSLCLKLVCPGNRTWEWDLCAGQLLERALWDSTYNGVREDAWGEGKDKLIYLQGCFHRGLGRSYQGLLWSRDGHSEQFSEQSIQGTRPLYPNMHQSVGASCSQGEGMVLGKAVPFKPS